MALVLLRKQHFVCEDYCKAEIINCIFDSCHVCSLLLLEFALFKCNILCLLRYLLYSRFLFIFCLSVQIFVCVFFILCCISEI